MGAAYPETAGVTSCASASSSSSRRSSSSCASSCGLLDGLLLAFFVALHFAAPGARRVDSWHGWSVRTPGPASSAAPRRSGRRRSRGTAGRAGRGRGKGGRRAPSVVDRQEQARGHAPPRPMAMSAWFGRLGEGPDRRVAAGRADPHPDPRVLRGRRVPRSRGGASPWRSCRPGAAAASDSRRLWTGSSSVLLAGSSARASPRIQPPCTKVSLPSGRISLIVTSRSTFGFDERTQTSTAPTPSTVVSAVSGVGRVGDRGAGRVLVPLVGRGGGPQPAARAGVAREVGRGAVRAVVGEAVGGGLGRGSRSARRHRRSTRSGRSCPGAGNCVVVR